VKDGKLKGKLKHKESSDFELLCDYISRARERGELRLPPERELGEELGLTRSRLRGLLKKLADEGSIWREVGSGTYFGQRPLHGAGAAHNTDIGELTNPREVMEARLLLEPELARLAAVRARGDNISELDLCMQKMKESGSRSDWTFWDQRFHRAIGRAADSMLLLALLDMIQSTMNRGIWGELADRLHQHESHTGSMNDHDAILNPIKSRNPKQAFESMRSHLLRVQNIYFGA